MVEKDTIILILKWILIQNISPSVAGVVTVFELLLYITNAHIKSN